jgi:S-formylglutathione hydrolase
MEILSQHRCFGGVQYFARHASTECAGPMRVAVYEPPQARERPVPVIYYLAGLTCTEETFAIKAGAQRVAAALGLMLVAPDTSPREPRLPGDDACWEFGVGAGFYVDATEVPWSAHYRMYSYVTRELPDLIASHFRADPGRQSIMGHSMGGHGALVCALREPARYRSVSALAPICAPSTVRWGQQAFRGYLGEDPRGWSAYDASLLVASRPRRDEILVDQGTADKFLAEQLRPDAFAAACTRSGQPLRLRMQRDYDHGYYFIQTFMPEHLEFHAHALHADG